MTDWRSGASLAALQARSRLLGNIRAFFAQRQVLEVDTPILARFGVTDPAIEPLRSVASAPEGASMFLQSSPEFAMKRLLAAGSGPIYQLGKAFRHGEVGARHNPEFTLLEWYRPGLPAKELIREVAELVCECLDRDDWSVVSYGALFEEVLGLDPWAVSASELKAVAAGQLDVGTLDLDYDGWLDLLMSHVIEPSLALRGLLFVCDYPPSQAALAGCTDRDGRRVAERFELYVDGIELANGYQELLDVWELEQRAAQDNERRRAGGQEERALDSRLVAAMKEGLPPCSGVALGVDRLLMAQLGVDRLSAVMPFDWSRA
ncbi:EF-P lysine aminoacylase EpmA [Congregibacter litoralis]|uniref:EF-P lysine aminoacylase GenX n=1 Tax=Congregibacter litoralis KT71 TaxID=314285 RepID=A4A8Q4_9GAMM|nr:EF-P lysine aminoacylase EpmA [Congregibacter litoralis]EAQ97446.1 EF-P lysine aminoacylase GenX [Congregibacter litoralis KT71]